LEWKWIIFCMNWKQFQNFINKFLTKGLCTFYEKSRWSNAKYNFKSNLS
jgi:hypothetical protein